MNSSPAPAVASAVEVRPIGTGLPSMVPSVGRAARIGHDRRFARWMRTATGLASAPVFVSAPRTDRLAIEFTCAYGRAEIALDPDDWPSLQMAAAIAEPALARAVLDALLEPLTSRLAPRLPALQASSLRRYAGATLSSFPLPSLAARGATVTLVRVDEGLARHLEAALREDPCTGLERFAGLQLPARVRVLQRFFSAPRLHALAPGDIVLCGDRGPRGAALRVTLLIGLGTIMQADADIELHDHRAHLAAAPTLAQEASSTPPSAHLDGDGLQHLQVPVAFEIDTARVSLAELSSLDAGSVIELDMSLAEAAVRLVSHGQVIGLGQLVALGGRLGVRIERMGLESAAGSVAP